MLRYGRLTGHRKGLAALGAYEGIHPGYGRSLGIKPNQAPGVLGPFADELETGVGEYGPCCVLAWSWFGIYFNGLTLGFSFTPHAAGDSGAEHDIADVLVADTENTS